MSGSMPIKPLVPLTITIVLACAPAPPGGTPAETADYRIGTLSPANWGEGELETYMRMYTAQEAPRMLVESGQAMLVDAVAAPGAHAGLRALQAGGSAADAVFTTALTNMALTLGAGFSYAGVASLVYYDAETGRIHSMDAAWNTVREETDPLSIPRDAPSGRTALVPGFMAGVEAAHARFGRLPFGALFEPAIYFAEEGFELPPFLARWLLGGREVLEAVPEAKRVFTRPDGEWYEAGDRVQQPELAATLRRITAEGAGYMYTGPWARKLVESVRREGGHMTREDLSDYRVIWSEPAHATYNGFDIYAPGAPSTGGANTAEAMNLLELAQIRDLGLHTRSAEALYWMMRIAHVQYLMGVWIDPEIRSSYLPDVEVDLRHRTTKEHARRLWGAMQSDLWQEMLEADARARGDDGYEGHTDGVVAIDQWGNVAALTYTSNTNAWGGTGMFVDGVFIPDPGALYQKPMAQVAPGQRLPIALNPLIVLEDGEPVFASAAAGATIHETALQNLVSVLDFGLDPHMANETPKFLLYADPDLRQLTGEAPVHARILPASEFRPALLDSVRNMGQPIIELDSAKSRFLQAHWVGISIDLETGRLQGGLSAFAGGLAEGY